MALPEKLDQVVLRHEILSAEMSTGDLTPADFAKLSKDCLLYTSPSPRDRG